MAWGITKCRLFDSFARTTPLVICFCISLEDVIADAPSLTDDDSVSLSIVTDGGAMAEKQNACIR